MKNRVLPWSRGWLGSIIGSFGSAGRVIGLPRVPDGRVRSSRWGGAVGWVGGTSKQLSTMQETAILGCALAVGRVRGWFGAGKKYIWVGGN